jgi:type IV pilus assembly protein PilB
MNPGEHSMKKIGEILIENGSITQKQLGEALDCQKKQPAVLLGKVLIELGYVSEEDIVVAVATQFNVPYLPIGNFSLNETVESLMPKELIQKHVCVPLERIGNLLTVVMADPTNDQATQEIEEATKCRIQAFVATASEIAAVIKERFNLSISQTPELAEKIVKKTPADNSQPDPRV